MVDNNNSLTSEAQVRANRRNALRSTGPKNTSLSSKNALKHGLTAKKLVVMPLENPVEYETLLEQLHKDFQPETAMEQILVEQMATSIWRRNRIIRAERAEIEEGLAYAPLDFAEEESQRRQNAREGRSGGPPSSDFHIDLSPLDTSERLREQWAQDNGPIRDEDNDALKLLKSTNENRKRLHTEKQLRPPTDALTIRYESSLERQFYRALVMLAKMREARNGFVLQNQSKSR